MLLNIPYILSIHREADVVDAGGWASLTHLTTRDAMRGQEGKPEQQRADQPTTEPVMHPTAPVRVLLADDHRIMRQGLMMLLEEEADIEVVAEAADGKQAIEMTRRYKPDVVVMDITMPVLNGIEATRQITAEMPQVRVIGLSMHESADMDHAMREAGAVAYLAKGGQLDSLTAAIRQAAKAPDPSEDDHQGSP